MPEERITSIRVSAGTAPADPADLSPWDGTDPDNPQPKVWPVCPTCDVSWVYRKFLSFTTGNYVWAWSKDCKHKATPALHTADGPYQP